MAYILRPMNDTFVVINKVNGETLATFKSHSKAVKDIRRRYSEEAKGKVHPWFTHRTSS